MIESLKATALSISMNLDTALLEQKNILNDNVIVLDGLGKVEWLFIQLDGISIMQGLLIPEQRLYKVSLLFVFTKQVKIFSRGDKLDQLSGRLLEDHSFDVFVDIAQIIQNDFVWSFGSVDQLISRKVLQVDNILVYHFHGDILLDKWN